MIGGFLRSSVKPIVYGYINSHPFRHCAKKIPTIRWELNTYTILPRRERDSNTLPNVLITNNLKAAKISLYD